MTARRAEARVGSHGNGADDAFDQVPRVAASRLLSVLEAERERWFLWLPVLVGVGIAVYFRLAAEPVLAAALVPLALLIVLRCAGLDGAWTRIGTGALIAVTLGFTLAKVRSDMVAAPVLDRRMGPVEVKGVAELVEPRATRGQRITLRVISLGQLGPEKMPQRVRVRTLKKIDGLKAGDTLTLKAHLAPPSAPALPGGYDFARQAWFLGIGAVGYAIAAPVIEPPVGEASLIQDMRARIERLRQAIGARVTAMLPDQTGAIANALITGERGGISDATNAAFRDSGLFHVLSISGLHMAIMGGSAFFIVRLILAAIPALALRYPVKKWAAAMAIAASLGYLMISGAAFATVRSFIMITIMFIAILLDRPALALRNVALAALLILILFPESLLDVGFQMSFAAVVTLISAYELVREWWQRRGGGGGPGLASRGALFFGGIVLSTLIAGAAVAPFAAYHFHKSQQFAVLANLAAIPVCNIVVMPAALAALLLMPVGLETPALAVMGFGIGLMTAAAEWVAKLPGAVGRIAAISEAGFILMVAGGLWLTLWRTRWRLIGFAVIAAGLGLAPMTERADVLIGRDGRLVAVRVDGSQLSALPAAQSEFELKQWLEHDGDARTPAQAVRAGGLSCDAAGCTIGIRGATVSVSRHPAALADDCDRSHVLVMDVPRPRGCTKPATVVDFFSARMKGTHAIYIGGPDKVRVETVAHVRGERPWSPAHPWTKPRVPGRAAKDTSHVPAAGLSTAPQDSIEAPALPRPEVEDDEAAGDDVPADASAAQ